MKKQPNPQGKGLVPVMDSLAASRAVISVPPKYIDQIANELFTSLFILNSAFQFKPVVGKRYWLYRKNGKFRMSLVSPVEWGGSGFGQYIGECELHSDITWSLKLGDAAEKDTELIAIIKTKRQQFEDKLRNAKSLEEVLPVFEASLPFYQRVFASALAHSLSVSMHKSGIKQLSYQLAKGMLAGKIKT